MKKIIAILSMMALGATVPARANSIQNAAVLAAIFSTGSALSGTFSIIKICDTFSTISKLAKNPNDKKLSEEFVHNYADAFVGMYGMAAFYMATIVCLGYIIDNPA